MSMNNKIYVFAKENNKGILEFPKCNIDTKAYIGRNGLAHEKQEGDAKTPIGEFELGIILGTHQNVQNKNGLKYRQITQDMYWIDDSKSIYYNKLVNLSEVTKDWNSAEHLIEYPIQYEYLVEIKTNPKNIPGKGSAIFLHCSNHTPTAGCIAIDKKSMQKVIENIDEHTKIEIRSYSDEDMARFKK